ncbi:MAG: hypothetical protein C4519_16995 [Desulfobacteraceae bacterium]|nr:MAG: hypothetical protein C4519_16995 [Desulfobacteraceae bacterium]
MTYAGTLFLLSAALFALFPRLFVYPLAIILVRLGAALLYRSRNLCRHGRERQKRDGAGEQAESN